MLFRALDPTRRTTPGHRLPLFCLNSPPKLGGARGGLNKLFCRLSFPLVFCLQRYNFFLNYANILPIILVIFSIILVVLAEVLTALWQLMSYKTGQYLLELEEKPFAGRVVVRPHFKADRALRAKSLKQTHILLTQQRCRRNGYRLVTG